MLKATQLMALASASMVSAEEVVYDPVTLSQETYATEALETHFNNPRPVYNSAIVKKTLARYSGCRKKCHIDPVYPVSNGNTVNIQQSINQLGAYTSCVTKCAAKQMFHTSAERKDTMTKLYNIGFDKLVKSREYLSGNGEFGAISKDPIRLDNSCCISDDHYAPFDMLMIDVNSKNYYNVPKNEESDFNVHLEDNEVLSAYFAGDGDSGERMVSINALVAHCAAVEASFLDSVLEGNFCGTYEPFMKYLNLLKVHVGHLILRSGDDVQEPASCHKKDEENVNPYNPKAVRLTGKICVAKTYAFVNNHGVPTSGTKAVDCPWIKPKGLKTECLQDFIHVDANTYMTVEYDMDDSHDFHIITEGLPSDYSGDDESCTYGLDFSAEFADDYQTYHKYNAQQVITPDNVLALQNCMTKDFEYCNVAQYAEFLHTQLYVDDCEENGNALACLYKVETLKCDCMDAVLACYSSGGHFTTELTETLGSAASILCGFLLCQDESVYSLFGGDLAFERANVMRELLANIGLANSSGSFPAATFAFLAFGLGMVAFFTTKFITSSKKVLVTDGYRNLI